MSYIQPKTDFKDGDILYGIDLNASNEVVKAGVDDNFDRIQNLETSKQDTIDSSNKLDYSLLDNTPTIPSKTSDLTNDSGFIDNTYHDNSKQDQLVSGTNIKTINNISLLGSGDIQIGGGSGGTSNYNDLTNKPQINGVTLSGNQTSSDLGINVPTKTSDLTNDNNTVTDVNYVHTDNNYTTVEKNKLAGVDDNFVNKNQIKTAKTTSTTDTYCCDYVNNKFSNSIISDYGEVTSGSAWTEKVCSTISLPAGTYIVIGQLKSIPSSINNLLVYFSGGTIDGSVSYAKNNSFSGRVNITDVIKITSTTTIKLCLQPDANFSSVSIDCYLKAIKIGD